jgi:hypothetical protein
VETEVDVRDVRRVETRSGSTRYVLEAAHGSEYTTFRESIGEDAERYAGRRAVITYHGSAAPTATSISTRSLPSERDEVA